MDRDLASMVIIIISGCLGVLFAGILKALYDKGILIDEMITGTITITDLMTVTVLIWLIVGVMIAILRR
ncbi:MAG: hypothetical protein ACTSX6_10500 [Candidatus Heimdallarchaeaceae archaeon]